MTVSLGAPLIDVICPRCHSSQRVRPQQRYDPVCYLCSDCLTVWDITFSEAFAAETDPAPAPAPAVVATVRRSHD